MRRLPIIAVAAVLVVDAVLASSLAAGPDLGAVQKQPLNWAAIVMFLLFVLGTLGIRLAYR